MKTIFKTIFDNTIETLTQQLCAELNNLPLAEKVQALNSVRRALHNISPFKDEPVDMVEWVPSEQVQANAYNPNHVATPEMKLLEKSIASDGYTQPIVGFLVEDGQTEVVDGYHRSRIGKEKPKIRQRIQGYLPVTYIKPSQTGLNNRMAATIRHNRARGVHGVNPMKDIVVSLLQQGWTDVEVAAELGMDADEVLRFKQTAGIAELFKNHEYSKAWE